MYTLNYKTKTIMKKIFTLFAVISASFAFAGTPTIDGVYNASEGWGTAVATGDAVAGWSNANAKTLYVTYDNNYVYFAAECNADFWQQFIFAVNTQPGGSSTDSWGRQITYNHTNKPDFLFRGDIAKSNYTEYHVWNGSAWTGTGTNINAAGTEVKGSTATSGSGIAIFIEIRVPRSTIGWGTKCDVQFIISGDQNSHGSFDAIPNDNNSTDWAAPGNATTLTNYATNITMPVALNYFNGNVANNYANLNWASATEVNFSHYVVEQSNDNTKWNTTATVAAKGANSNYSTQVVINSNTFYKLKMVDKDGSYAYSKTLLLKKISKQNIELISNPVKDVVKVNINATKATNYTISIYNVEGKKVDTRTINHAGNGIVTYSFNAPAVKGNYYVTVISDNNENAQTLKLIVE